MANGSPGKKNHGIKTVTSFLLPRKKTLSLQLIVLGKSITVSKNNFSLWHQKSNVSVFLPQEATLRA
jgi:hypothetical protein